MNVSYILSFSGYCEPSNGYNMRLHLYLESILPLGCWLIENIDDKSLKVLYSKG